MREEYTNETDKDIECLSSETELSREQFNINIEIEWGVERDYIDRQV